jgi:CRP-like cAMP-binding protein
MATLDSILQLLLIPPPSRSSDQLRRLKLLTSDFKFFQQLTEEHGNDICHSRLCSRMTLSRFESGQYIFNFRDPGDFFCVILKGRVSVQVPEFTNSSSLRRNALATLRADNRLLRMAANSLEVDREPRSQQGISESHSEVEEAVKLNEVAILEAGSTFGELSLISGQPRVASVECQEATCCAVLSRQDYQELLGAYEQQRLQEKLAVLSSLPLFRGWTLSYLKKHHYYFKEVLYHRSAIVFSEGKPAEFLYIIKEGEFKVRPTQIYKHLPQANSKSSNLKSRAHLSYRRIEVRSTQLVIKGAGELLGDEELVRETSHFCSCECVSFTGVLITIKQTDMRYRVNHPEAWQRLNSKYESEGTWLSSRVGMLEKTVPEDPPKALEQVALRRRTKLSPLKSFEREVSFDTLKPRPRLHSPVYSDLAIKQLRKSSNRPLVTPRIKSRSTQRTLRSRPPPNFFVEASAAVKEKYKHRKKILDWSGL